MTTATALTRRSVTIQVDIPEDGDVSDIEGLVVPPELSRMVLRMLRACASAPSTPENVVPFRMPAGVP